MGAKPGAIRCRVLALALLASSFAGPAPAADELVTAVPFDLTRYMGQWRQIALIPNRFQDFCVSDTSAEYSVDPQGDVQVINRCRDAAGTQRSATGAARKNRRFDDPARLQVRFAPARLAFSPAVWGDYWVLEVEPDYSAALVGSPDRKYLWILARTSAIPTATYARFVAQAAKQGFATAKLQRTD